MIPRQTSSKDGIALTAVIAESSQSSSCPFAVASASDVPGSLSLLKQDWLSWTLTATGPFADLLCRYTAPTEHKHTLRRYIT